MPSDETVDCHDTKGSVFLELPQHKRGTYYTELPQVNLKTPGASMGITMPVTQTQERGIAVRENPASKKPHTQQATVLLNWI